MKILTKEQIFAAQDLRFVTVNVPEWGGKVRIKSMTGEDRDAFEMAITEATASDRKLNIKNIRARLVALTVVDDSGAPLFTEGDVAALAKKSAAALSRIYAAAQKLNALTNDDVEELAKN